MSLRVSVSGKVKFQRNGAEAKASLNRANLVASARRETKWATHGQVEAVVTHSGGPNPLTLKSYGMTCGLEWKANQTWRYLVLPEMHLGAALSIVL